MVYRVKHRNAGLTKYKVITHGIATLMTEYIIGVPLNSSVRAVANCALKSVGLGGERFDIEQLSNDLLIVTLINDPATLEIMRHAP